MIFLDRMLKDKEVNKLEYKLSNNSMQVLVTIILASMVIVVVMLVQMVTISGTMNISGNMDTTGSWVNGVGILGEYPDAYANVRLNEIEGTIEIHYEVEVPLIVWIISEYEIPNTAQSVSIMDR